jgi:hypothetical protein
MLKAVDVTLLLAIIIAGSHDWVCIYDFGVEARRKETSRKTKT